MTNTTTIGAGTGTVFDTNPMAVFTGVMVGLNLLWLCSRCLISKSTLPGAGVLRSIPLLKLSQAPTGNTPGELLTFCIMFTGVALFYTNVWDPEGRRRTRENPVPIIEYRFQLLAASMVFQTVLFRFARQRVVHSLPEDQRDAQAANVVRVTVKIGLFAYCFFCGNWWNITFKHPGELTEEDFETAYWGPMGMAMLYGWELLFRDLKPINFIHHGASLMAAWSVLEWYDDGIAGNTVRKFTPVGTVMSFTEGFCCLGTICYRYASRPTASHVMLLDAGFVAVVYNLIASWWIYTLASNWETFDETSRYVSCPLILALTYPAQMNMVRIFYILHKKAAREARAEKAKEKAAQASGSESEEEKLTPPLQAKHQWTLKRAFYDRSWKLSPAKLLPRTALRRLSHRSAAAE
eukprot:TRINITY_DN26905_c1_g2_i1.p2 TRINITY_DN26905_c1_g2~~TRINITY_DN26905_c1_g2_i1.p2  ORF type:complete len:407 (+),score=134.61 TRINITY_DN26905_c1_g2_i1:92-1312(+)